MANYFIKHVKLSSPFLLAPMAGITDVAFRSIARELGAGLTYTEMVSAKALVFGSEKTKQLLETASNEVPCAVQIFGHEPEIMAKACQLPELQKFDIIDINMGCPAPKIVQNGEGSALMKQIDLAEKIIKACVRATNKPITVKFRAGWSEETCNAVEFAKMCERAGASAITVHGRTREQFYSGKSNPEIIKACVQAVHIPVFANGDVFTAQDAYLLQEKTGAYGVMIARGAIGNPEIFSEVTHNVCPYTKLQLIEKHYSFLLHRLPERVVVPAMRVHLASYLKGYDGSSKLRAALMQETSWQNIHDALVAFFKDK